MKKPNHSQSANHRHAAVAGRFYPGDAKKLTEFLEEHCKTSRQKKNARAIMVPHAGYIYSGDTAAKVYEKIAAPEVAIILCPNHTGAGLRISVWESGEWETPLGNVSVDSPIATAILAEIGQQCSDTEAHRTEHAIEVQLPFLQYMNPAVSIVPIALGPLAYEDCEKLGLALAKAVSGSQSRCLLVASTDMSHYIAADKAKTLDDLALARVKALDPNGLYSTVVQNEITMCGFIPTTCVLKAATELGCHDVEIVSYTNSGDVTKDYRSVVAYAGAIIS